MQELIQAFDETSALPHAWWNRGRDLLISSDILSREWHPERLLSSPSRTRGDFTWEVHAPRLLLRACAIECFLKAVYVSNGGVLSQNGRYQKPGSGRSHDLEALARAAGLTLNNQETFLLRQLSLWIERGRYPLPASWERDLIETPQGKIIGHGWDDETDEAAFAAFRSRIAALGRQMAENAGRSA